MQPGSGSDPGQSRSRTRASPTRAPFQRAVQAPAAPATCPALLLLSRRLWAQEARALLAPPEVEPAGQATVPLLSDPATLLPHPSLHNSRRNRGGKSRKVLFESHFTVPSIGLTHGTPIYPMPPCCLEHFSFGRRKEGGKFSNISGVQR